MNSASLKLKEPEVEAPPGATTPKRKALVVDDIRILRAYVTAGERDARFQALHQPEAWRVVRDLTETWGLILASWALCFYGSWLWAPLALLIIGSRQRALGNRLHDASHGHMLAGRAPNQHVGTLVCALPMFEDYELYRLQHLRHHAYLGTPGKDPDYLELPSQEPGQPPLGPWAIFARFAFSPGMWRDSVLATLHKVDAKKRLQVLAWWACFLGVFALVAGPRAAASFALLWLAARASVYHLVKVFAEISDHVGLVPGNIIGYTRNLPGNWLSFFMHPHHDNYHLTHHLFPRIPLSQLPRMHELLMEVGLYARAHHCDSYFLGETSVVRSWIHPKPEPVSLVSVSP